MQTASHRDRGAKTDRVYLLHSLESLHLSYLSHMHTAQARPKQGPACLYIVLFMVAGGQCEY